MMKIHFYAMPIALILGACNSSNKTVKPKENTVPKVEVRNMNGLKIAFYNNDSLKVHFEYFKKEEAIVKRKQEQFQKQLELKQKELQDFITRNNDRLRNGQLSENDQIMIQQKVQRMEAELMQYQQNEGSRLEQETMKKLELIAKKIEVMGKEFSEKNNIDLFVAHGQGGQFNYIKPSMDVTKEFTAYLNQKQEELEKDLK